MSHNLHITFKDATVAVAVVTFTAYTHGGETFNMSEFSLVGILNNVFFAVSKGANDVQVDRDLVSSTATSFKVKLLATNAGNADSEMPTTAVLNLQAIMVVTLTGS
jgi:hypothetical protein